MRSVDYLIIGQGLAGSVLAHTMRQHQLKVMVVDRPREGGASRVAAGVVNPVSLRRLTKSWRAEEFLPGLMTYYKGMEAATGGRYYHQRSLHRIFTSADERAFWTTRRQEPALSELLSAPDEHPTVDLPAPDGLGEVKGTGWLDVPAMLKHVRDWLLDHDSLLEEEFHPSRLTDTPEGVRWHSDSGEVLARKAIFCEGYRMVMNPFFRWLPMRPAKGELLLIEVPGLNLDHLTHRGLFLVPMGGARYWAGATYAWGDLRPDPTEAQRQHILEKLEKLLGRPFKVLAHQTGIRPTVRDRRPLIGLHPARPNLAVFNGLGTKGVMLVPHFAQQFTDFLQGNAVLDPAVNIARFAHCLNGPVPRAGGLDKPIT